MATGQARRAKCVAKALLMLTLLHPLSAGRAGDIIHLTAAAAGEIADMPLHPTLAFVVAGIAAGRAALFARLAYPSAGPASCRLPTFVTGWYGLLGMKRHRSHQSQKRNCIRHQRVTTSRLLHSTERWLAAGRRPAPACDGRTCSAAFDGLPAVHLRASASTVPFVTASTADASVMTSSSISAF